jgi:hypothetical protein
MARTAVITGTAAATMGVVGKAMGPKGAPAGTPPPPAQAAAPPPAGLSDETLAKLKQLGELRTSGVLNEQEFAEAKAKLLA